MILLVTGGSGCGKSAYAERRVTELAAKGNKAIYYLATMLIFGEEGRKKVERHKELRRGKGMQTLEQTRDVAEAALRIQERDAVILLEDMGNLVANEMFSESGEMTPWETVAEKIIRQVMELSKKVSHLVIVTNNVFEDGIPYEEGTQGYLKALGRVNQVLAEKAREVTEVVAGIPLRRKGSSYGE